MNYLRNMKKPFDVVFVSLLVLILISVVLFGCGRNEPEESVEETEQITENVTESVQEQTEQPEEPKLVCLGTYKLTAYCGCSKCCGKWGENRPVDEYGKTIVRTAGGYRAVEGVTVAADISVLPYGTKVIINDHEYTVQDRGGAINGNIIDIYFEFHQAALEFGVQYANVYVYEKIERKVETNDQM
ncbi:MAG: 3D domain-containing protein [Clostridia bacterium]|nr:3D domain-containing protein [Clostridia bacterium]